MSESELGKTGSPESIAAAEGLLKKNRNTTAEMMEHFGASPDALNELISNDSARGEVVVTALQMLGCLQKSDQDELKAGSV